MTAQSVAIPALFLLSLGLVLAAMIAELTTDRTAPAVAECWATLRASYPDYAWESAIVYETTPTVCLAEYRPVLAPDVARVREPVQVELPVSAPLAPPSPTVVPLMLGAGALFTIVLFWTLWTSRKRGGKAS